MDQLPCSSAAVPLPPSSVSNKIAMTLVDEATAAIQEVSFAVKEIAISRELPRMVNIFWILVTILGCLFNYGSAQGFAAMSVDFGSEFIKIGLIRPGKPMEIVLNKESHRKTPNALLIHKNERYFGDAAVALRARHPSSFIDKFIDLVAKPIDHPVVRRYQKNYPFVTLTSIRNGSSVGFVFDEQTYSIESVIAMMLRYSRDLAEAFAEQPVKDTVIAVPSYFNQAERRAFVTSAKIARLNLLQLINSGTAAALGHAVFKRKHITDKIERILVYDMGSAQTTVTIIELKLAKDSKGYKEPHQTTLGIGFDRTLGGEEITLRMRDHIAKKFREHYKAKMDIDSNPKAWAKLYKEANRVKKVLSANVDHYAQIESVHEDIDMRVLVTRDELNNLITDLEDRIAQPVNDAFNMAELTIDVIDKIVLMGASTRIPKVQVILKSVFGNKELGKFLNTDEAIALGGLYQAAHLSKGFKAKPFYVVDLTLYPIQVYFNSTKTETTKKTLFAYKSFYPSAKKVMSFTSFKTDFGFEMHYGDLSHLPVLYLEQFGPLQISSINISGLTKAVEEHFKEEDSEYKGVKITFTMDWSGLAQVERAEVVIERKPRNIVESITDTISGYFGSSKTDESSEETDAQKENSVESEAKPMPTEAATAEAENSAPKPHSNDTKKNQTEEAAKKKQSDAKVTKLKLSVSEQCMDAVAPSAEETKETTSLLDRFESEERLRAQRQHAENELEAFAFDASQLVEDEDFVLHSTSDERNQLSAEVIRVRAWLEDVVSDTPTAEFDKNFNTLKQIVKPIKQRSKETHERPALLKDLEMYINMSAELINTARTNMTMSEYAESSTQQTVLGEIEAFNTKIEKLAAWLKEKKDAQELLRPHNDVVLKIDELKSKTSALQRATNAFLKKVMQIIEKDEKAAKKKAREAAKANKEASASSTNANAKDSSASTSKQPEEPSADAKSEL